MKEPKDYLDELHERFPEIDVSMVNAAYLLLLQCYHAKGKIMLCGNGGCASDSEHIVGELMKGFHCERPLPKNDREAFSKMGTDGQFLARSLQTGFPAVSLNSQTSLMTAIGNDKSFDVVYSQQVYVYGNIGDTLLAMSTSGNSRNILLAIQTAKTKGISTIGITGSAGGSMAALCDVTICLPADDTSRIQEYSLVVYHSLCSMLEAKLFSL